VAAEQQEDPLMKIVFAGVVFATLMVSPLFARPQSTEELPHSGAYQNQKKQVRIDYRDLDGSARKSNRPTSTPDPIKQLAVRFRNLVARLGVITISFRLSRRRVFIPLEMCDVATARHPA
jgi:hypothetical protein